MIKIRVNETNLVVFIDFEGKTKGNDLIKVDEIPEIIPKDGKLSKLIYNQETKNVEVHYFDIPKDVQDQTQTPTIQDQLDNIQSVLAAMIGGAV